MIQAYHFLGLDDLATNSLAVLKANYPDYPYLNAQGSFNYQENPQEIRRSWLNIATAGLLGRSEEIGFDTRKLYNKENRNYEGK